MFDDLWSTISGWFGGSSDSGDSGPTTTPLPDEGTATTTDPGYTVNASGDKVWSDGQNTTVIKNDGTILVNGQNMGQVESSDPSVGSMINNIFKTVGTGALGAVKNMVTTNGKIDPMKLASIGGGLLGGFASGQSWAQPQITKTGYQGGIPSYTSVREQVPGTYDPNRRPGSRGQEYFTQQQYVSPSNVATAQAAAAEEAKAAEARNKARTAEYAGGGLAYLAGGNYLAGSTDGMADKIPATIAGKQPAKLSHGEFVVPADVVSHLGNGNSEAGAERLYGMMDKIRKARTGTTKQGKQINPNKYLPG